jgi:hypothetical protein
MKVNNRCAEDVRQDALDAFKRVSGSGAFRRGWLWGYGTREETVQYF